LRGRGLRGRRLGEPERPLLPARREERGGDRRRGEGAYHPGIMTESDFHIAVDAVLARIEGALEAHDALDVDLEGGVLEIECPDASRIIVNRQTPNREIWVAARSGGYHFALREGAWRDTRSGDELFASLARVIAAQSGETVGFG
jgi:iron-sulfur cluster assembly protein CyaY